MNKVMDPMKTAKTMQEFEKQNMKMEMTEEMSKSSSLLIFQNHTVLSLLHCITEGVKT